MENIENLIKKICPNGVKLKNTYDSDYVMFINSDKCIAIYKDIDGYLKVDNLF